MLCLLLVGRRMKRKNKKKREVTGLFFFPQGLSCVSLAGCAEHDFCNC
jgi:hypothetical protein